MIGSEKSAVRQVGGISSPAIGSVVIYHESKEKCYPVYILDGYYLDPIYQRLSNFWQWRKVNEDGTLGEKENGYGLFSDIDKEYEVVVKVVFGGAKA